VSYFGGDKDKAASDALGIRGVAMEDYHVIRVLRSAMTKGVLEKSDYPIIYDWRVDRINADPKKLPPNVENDFNNFYRTQRHGAERTAPGMATLLTIDDYVKVVIWGLRGVLRGDVSHEELRNSVDWKYARTIPAGERPKYFWSFAGDVGGDDFFIPDPFCIEIATDFINTLAEMNPDKADSGISNFTYGRANKERARELAGAVQEAWLSEDTANSTWKTIYDSAAPGGTKAKIRILMEHLRDNCGFGIEGADRRYVKTWLRPGGKWEGVGSYATLQDATNDSRFKAAAIDRAFYKSSNMMALQTYAAHGIWNDSRPRP
jgi:hypothetical protein